jgi:hypothetical protein
MEEFLVVVAVFVVGFIFGWDFRERTARKFVDKFLSENLDTLQRHVDENTVSIIIERHGEMLYIFQKDDSSFMAQGKNREELESALAKKYPGKQFFASPENLKEVGFK